MDIFAPIVVWTCAAVIVAARGRTRMLRMASQRTCEVLFAHLLRAWAVQEADHASKSQPSRTAKDQLPPLAAINSVSAVFQAC